MLVGIDRPIRRSSRSSPPTASTGPARVRLGRRARQRRDDAVRGRGAERVVARVLARDRSRARRAPARTGRGRGSRARSPCRPPRPRPAGPTARSSSLDELRAAAAHARDVGADVSDPGRPRLQREQGVEARDAVRLGGRDGQPAADVAERGRADPADPAPAPRAGRAGAGGAATGPRGRRARNGRRTRARRPPRPSAGGPSTASTASRSAAEGSFAVRRRSTQVQLAARRLAPSRLAAASRPGSRWP